MDKYTERIKYFKQIGKRLVKQWNNKYEFEKIRKEAYERYGEYINAWNFNYITKKSIFIKQKYKKLYWVISDKGFYKIGITNNIKVRLIDLNEEFNCKFKLISIINDGNLEKQIHKQLEKHKLNIIKHNGKVSTECFKINEETKNYLNKIFI